ncbi:MAG: glycosyltransferase [Pseudomonadota bacterium]
MSQASVQTIGITRWSYPGTTAGFISASSDLDTLRAALYAPERLEHRLFLLENLTLPCLRWQTDPDFLHLFVMGDELPEPWRGRLVALLDTVPQIVPVFAPEGQNLGQLCAEVIAAHQDGTSDVLAQYRLDDDDAISVDFVEKLRGAFPRLAPFYEADQRICLDFSRGFVMDARTADLDFIPISARQWAPGLVIYQKAETAACVFEFPHMRVWHFMATVTMREDPMFIRGIHHTNDSDVAQFGRRTRSFTFRPASKRRFFRRRFAIDILTLEALWRENYGRFGCLPPAAQTAQTRQAG